MRYKGFEIIESSRHGQAGKGLKKTSSIQIREHLTKKGYLLRKQISFPVRDNIKREKAINKAKKYVDQILNSSKNILKKLEK